MESCFDMGTLHGNPARVVQHAGDSSSPARIAPQSRVSVYVFLLRVNKKLLLHSNKEQNTDAKQREESEHE